MGYDTTPLVAASSRDEWAGDRILTSDLSNASESPPVEPIKPPYRLWVAGIACWLAESYQMTAPFAFATFMVRDQSGTSGGEDKVGLYAGVLAGSNYAGQVVSAIPWSRAASRYGIRPCVMVGLALTTILNVAFGFCTNYWAGVTVRFLGGLCDGNLALIKTLVAQGSPESLRATGMAYLSATYSFGAIVGPVIAGVLARPAYQYPSVFTSGVLVRFPYLLAQLVTAGVVLVAAIIVALTMAGAAGRSAEAAASAASAAQAASSCEYYELKTLSDMEDDQLVSPTTSKHTSSKPPTRNATPWLPPLTYAFLSLMFVCIDETLPIFFSSPPHKGGLDWAPVRIGAVYGLLGCANILASIFAFPRLEPRLRLLPVFRLGLYLNLPAVLLFPLLSVAQSRSGDPAAWSVVVLVAALYSTSQALSFAAGMNFVNNAVPHSSLLRINGLTQTLISIARCTGPLIAGGLWTLIASAALWRVYMDFLILGVVTVAVICVSFKLPEKLNRPYVVCLSDGPSE